MHIERVLSNFASRAESDCVVFAIRNQDPDIELHECQNRYAGDVDTNSVLTAIYDDWPGGRV